MSNTAEEIKVPYDLGYYIAKRDEPQLPNMDGDAQIDFVAPYEKMVLNVCEYHTTQRLTTVKEKVGELNLTGRGASSSLEYHQGFGECLEQVKTLIEEELQ